MKTGVLILTHDGIGPALLGTVTHMLGVTTIPAKLLNASTEDSPDQLMAHVEEMIETLDEGHGVLVLTDLAGSTPSNIAAKLAGEKNIRIVGGVNISMLLRVLNYPDLDLPDLAEKALSGGRDGIYEITVEHNAAQGTDNNK